MALSRIEDSRQRLADLLSDAEAWVQELARPAPSTNGPDGIPAQEAQAVLQTLALLRTRTSASLLNIGFIGAQSAGKSFLISGIVGGLSLTYVDSEFGPAEKFVGVLPSSPTPMTSCPVSVIPTECDKPTFEGYRGSLRFRASGASQWTDVEESPSPATLQAYVSKEADKTGRREDHWQIPVAEIEIEYCNSRVPATMYDLPGFGGLDESMDRIVWDQMRNAECFVYVAPATRTLTAADRDGILTLYHHYRSSGAPVIWVLTAIDRAMDLGVDDTPNWTLAKKQNDAYLRELLSAAGQSDDDFIGDGFIPVSPAYEAHAAYSLGSQDLRKAERLRSLSGMDGLRDRLTRLINQQTGERHIDGIARRARLALDAIQRTQRAELRAASMSVQKLKRERDRLEDRISAMQVAAQAIERELSADLETCLGEVTSIFTHRSRGLAKVVHSQLDSEIKAANLRKPSVVDGLQLKKAEAVRQWVDISANAVWERQLRGLKRKASELLRPAVGSRIRISSGIDDLEIDELIAPPATVELPDNLLKVAAEVAPLTTPFAAGGVAALAAIATGPTLMVPGAVAVAAMLTYGAVAFRNRWSAGSDAMRTAMIRSIDDDAVRCQERFLELAREAGNEVISRTRAVATYKIGDASGMLAAAVRRLNNPHTIRREAAVAHLRPLCERGDDIISELRSLQLD